MAPPSVSSTISRPGKHLRSDRSRWRIPGEPGHATKRAYLRQQQLYISAFFFPSLEASRFFQAIFGRLKSDCPKSQTKIDLGVLHIHSDPIKCDGGMQ